MVLPAVGGEAQSWVAQRGTDSYRPFLQRGNRGSQEGTSLPGGSSGPSLGTQGPLPVG